MIDLVLYVLALIAFLYAIWRNDPRGAYAGAALFVLTFIV